MISSVQGNQDSSFALQTQKETGMQAFIKTANSMSGPTK
jgi:hypothetical protein